MKGKNMPLQSYTVGKRTIKLGKQAARYDARTLQFSNYLKAAAPPSGNWRTGAQLLPVHDVLGPTVAVGMDFDREILGGAPHDLLGEFLLVLDILLALALLDAVQRGLGDVHMAARNQLVHVAEEERQ